MLNWLKRRSARKQQEKWVRVHQMPGTVFAFPRGATLRPEEEVVLALPSEVIAGDETIGSVLLCDDNAELTLDDKAGAWYVKLKAGMAFALAESCEIVLVGGDDRPRFFQYLPPEHRITEAGAAPKDGPAPQPGNPGVTEGPPSVS